MNRTLKEATVRRYHYDSHHQLRQHIQTFLDAYNFAKRLKTLNGLTPFESICKAWTKEPNRFKYRDRGTASVDRATGTGYRRGPYFSPLGVVSKRENA